MQPPIDRLLRTSLRSFAPYKPGTSVDEVRRRFGIEHPVKLSQNENPLGSSPRALEALRAIGTLSDYVEDDHVALRTRLSLPYALGPECVILGHGSNELVQLAFTAFVDPGDEVVVARPSFSLFRKDTQVAGGVAVEVPLRDGVHDLDAMLAAVTPRTKLLFVCDPNNPTGTRVERSALFAFADALPQNVLLVIDQAYREFMDDAGADGVEVLRRRPATLVLRTASKIYGLASVRFGYGYASAEIAGWLDRVRLPFNVSRTAAVAVLAALDDDDFIARSLALNVAGKVQLMEGFARLGLHAYPSAANFIAVAVPTCADVAYEALLARGVIVRSGDGLGMPGRLRVTIGTQHENEAFLAALEALFAVVASRPGARVIGEVNLRAGGPSDRSFVLDLGRRTSVDSISALRTPPPAFVEYSYEQLLAFAFERSHVLLIAETPLEGPVGFLLMLDELPDEVTGMPQGFIAYMAVEPDARRHGVATRLLAAAEDAARVRGLPHVALMVTEDNAPAREFYAQVGFVTERRLLCKQL